MYFKTKYGRTKKNYSNLELGLRSYFTFFVIQFILIIIWTIIFGNGGMQWTGAGIYSLLTLIVIAPINTIIILILYLNKSCRNSLRRTGFLILESTAYFVVYFTLYELQQHNHYLGEMLHRTQDSLLALIVPYIILVPLCLIYISIFNHVQKKQPHL